MPFNISCCPDVIMENAIVFAEVTKDLVCFDTKINDTCINNNNLAFETKNSHAREEVNMNVLMYPRFNASQEEKK